MQRAAADADWRAASRDLQWVYPVVFCLAQTHSEEERRKTCWSPPLQTSDR